MDVPSFTGASGGVLIAFAILKFIEYVRDILVRREEKQMGGRAVKNETKAIKLNGTRCDGHAALTAEIVSIKDDVKEVSQKLDKYSEQIFDRLRLVEKDVAVLQVKK